MNAVRLGHLGVVAVASAFTAVTVRYASFAAAISDSSGYVSEATRWLRSDLFVPQPFAFWPDWPIHWSVPLAYRTGPLVGADVFTYPPGLPMTMAAAMVWGGELAAHLVPPVLGGLLAWAAGDLAARLAGPSARVISSALMATSAIAVLMAVQPMSDVPAAAWWALALVFSLRGRGVATLAAGLTVSMAVLTRPNLAPLALVPGVLVMLAAPPARRILFGSLFGCAAVVGPLLLMWLQQILYGSPWTSGHPGVEGMFSLSNVMPNLLAYPRWYAEAHTSLVVLAILAPIVFWRAREPTPHTERVSQRSLALSLMVVVLGVYVAYLPYVQWTSWPFVRFMLPALAPLYALTAAVLVRGVQRLPRVAQAPVLALVAVVSIGGQARETYARGVAGTWNDNARVVMAGHYLAEALPPNAVVITAFHSNSIRHYADRPILRPDGFQPERLDSLVARLEAGGYHPYLLLDDWLERAGFLDLFKSSRYGALDWPPRALIGSHGGIVLYDPHDRERHARGERWPIDVVR